MSSDDGKLAAEKIIVGKITGVYGVKGWVKVYSYTEPRDSIVDYNPWYLKQAPSESGAWREVRVEQGRTQAKTVVARLEGCDDRDEAMLLAGSVIAIAPEQLEALSENEYYWRDLIGCRVINQQDIELGVVQSLMETGANDVLVVKADDREAREHLIPWTMGQAVIAIELKQRLIRVDWDEDF